MVQYRHKEIMGVIWTTKTKSLRVGISEAFLFQILDEEGLNSAGLLPLIVVIQPFDDVVRRYGSRDGNKN